MNQETGLFGRCFAIFRHSPALYIGVAALPYATVHVGFLGVFTLFMQDIAGAGANLRTVWLVMTMGNRMEFLGLFFLWITVPYAVAGRGICRATSEQIAGRQITFLEAALDMLVFIPAAFLLGAIASVASFFGAMFLFAPGFVAGSAFSLVVPAGAVEAIGPFASLRRGVSLVWRVFGRVLLLFFGYNVVVIAALVMQGILGAAAPHELYVRLPIMVICSFLPIIPLVFLYICFTLLFLEARERKQVTATAIGSAGA